MAESWIRMRGSLVTNPKVLHMSRVVLSAPAPPTGELATVNGTDQLPGGQPARLRVAADGLVVVIGAPGS